MAEIRKNLYFKKGHLALMAAVISAAGCILLIRSFAAAPNALKGDVNGDGAVNITDLSILLSNYGKTAAQSTNSNADINQDGAVNIIDLSILLSNYGKSESAINTPPLAGGYFSLKPVGSFSSLPSDSQAAALVHRSSWEPRPENATANQTVPPPTFITAGYAGMKNHAAVFGRVTGNFKGTTDEIIQWAAIKWGLPDELIRAEAVTESSWYQNLKTATGAPISGKGYGDFGSCSGVGSPPPSGYGTTGPSSFGLLQDKWCALKDASASGYDGWPWSENSTAYSIDLYAAVLRGCYEGWDTWLGTGYTSGDIWGCVGRWYSGQWHTAAANSYISNVQNNYNTKPWLIWSSQ